MPSCLCRHVNITNHGPWWRMQELFANIMHMMKMMHGVESVNGGPEFEPSNRRRMPSCYVAWPSQTTVRPVVSVPCGTRLAEVDVLEPRPLFFGDLTVCWPVNAHKTHSRVHASPAVQPRKSMARRGFSGREKTESSHTHTHTHTHKVQTSTIPDRMSAKISASRSPSFHKSS